MNLSALPDLRAAQAPDAPAVADDNVDLNNIQFFDAVRRASATMREHGVAPGDVGGDHAAQPSQLRRGAVRGMAAGCGGHPDQPDTGACRGVPTSSRTPLRKYSSSRSRLEFDAPVRAVVTTAELASGAAAGVAEPVQHRDDALAC